MSSEQATDFAAAPVHQPKFVLCKKQNNPHPVWVPEDDCKSPPDQIVQPLGLAPPELFPYRLPSGREVVGRNEDYEKDIGTIVYGIATPIADISTLEGTQLVICKLPSGLGVVETYDECLRDGGTVLGTIVSQV